MSRQFWILPIRRIRTETTGSQADISVTVQVKDVQGAAYAASDTFYAMLYQDADRTQKVLSTPLTFAMSGAAALTQSTQVR